MGISWSNVNHSTLKLTFCFLHNGRSRKEKKCYPNDDFSFFSPVHSFILSVVKSNPIYVFFFFNLFSTGPNLFPRKKTEFNFGCTACIQFKEWKSGFGKRKRLFILFNVMPLRNFSIDNNAPTWWTITLPHCVRVLLKKKKTRRVRVKQKQCIHTEKNERIHRI